MSSRSNTKRVSTDSLTLNKEVIKTAPVVRSLGADVIIVWILFDQNYTDGKS